jgi:polysaccharide export outer membrane protein
LIACSCSPARNLIYFSDLKNTTEYTEEIKNRAEPKIQPDDLLSINVSTLNPESNILFNNGVMQAIGGVSTANNATRANDGYLVDKNGSINFPVLGNIKLAGLTKTEAADKMVSEIKNSVKNPIVNIRFMNFKITVIGEVNRPSTFNIPTERINMIEALGLAGDLTLYGKRENVLLIREKSGVRSAIRVNLASKDILNSPYFYLQQNDILYVEPVKAKALQSSSTSFYLPILSVAVSIMTIVLLALKN